MAGNRSTARPQEQAAGILGNIAAGSAPGGLIPVPLTQVDLAPASALLMDEIRSDLNAPPRWKPKDDSVTLSDDMRWKADAIARDFHARTGRELVVTDGSRTPADQARVMYEKFAMGDATTYRGPSGREIRAIYDNAMVAGQDRETALKSMTTRIAEQFANSRPVSRHLQKEGLDFRTDGMKEAEVKILQEAIRQNGGKYLPEGKPVHMHGSFPRGPR